ncbi:carbohydrate ABC transporter permease [Oceanospirillum sediminis]|uniref:Sugar ABC transporter permease n=1 Tax=Oceanospirillum sediminis TaxID=2760088 RepID=A0A839IM12_9GAMM|nr:sugar ABC transporter permease [Oceanospirillum sediminis]MBB1485750.1 sugar ABC transporter permease [Oceanospirillum sediminis]
MTSAALKPGLFRPNLVRQAQAWLLLLPALIFLLAFTHLPTVSTVWNSFFSTSAGTPVDFSTENYQFLLEDEVFCQVLDNSFWYAVVTVPASMALALAMALWVNSKLSGKAALRLAYFTPTILPMISVANIWLFFYSPEIGLFNQILEWFGSDGYNWLGDPDLSLPSLMVMTIWKEAGFFMIFYLAALQAISPELYQAAEIEGASRFRMLRRITLPLLMPTTLFVLVNAILNAFKLVDHLFILTKGGPNNASNLLLYYIYENAFSFFDTAYAAALTVVLLMILVVLALLQFGVLERRVHYR